MDFPRGSRFACPQCEAACPVHDTTPKTWRHLDFFQHVALLHARFPRTKCPEHGVLQVNVPWAREGSGFTMLFDAYVMLLTAQMPVAALARFLRETDQKLWRVIHWHVAGARERVDMSEVKEVVVDETARRARGQTYVSRALEPAATDEDDKVTRPSRALFVADGRTHQVFHDFTADLTAHGGTVTNILNYLLIRRTSEIAEGINSFAQAARARARECRSPETFKTNIFLLAGRLRFALPSTH